MARMVKTEEEKAGQKIANIISDVRLDAELVGTYLGASEHADVLNRLVVMVDGIVESRARLRERLGYTDETVTTVDVKKAYDSEIERRCAVLAEFYEVYRDDEDFEDFITYADIALLAAYLVNLGVVSPSKKFEQYVNEAWVMLLNRQNVDINTDVNSLEDLGL